MLTSLSLFSTLAMLAFSAARAAPTTELQARSGTLEYSVSNYMSCEFPEVDNRPPGVGPWTFDFNSDSYTVQWWTLKIYHNDGNAFDWQNPTQALDKTLACHIFTDPNVPIKNANRVDTTDSGDYIRVLKTGGVNPEGIREAKCVEK